MNFEQTLNGVRVLAVLNSPELFGHERGNIEVFKALRSQGAEVCVGVTAAYDGGAVKKELEMLGFATFPIPFGTHWSKRFFLKNPFYVLSNLWHLFLSNRAVTTEILRFRPTHVHLGNAFAYSWIFRALHRSGVPLIVRLGDAAPITSSVQMTIWRHFIKTANKVVANSMYVWTTVAKASEDLCDRAPRIIHNLAPSGMQGITHPNYDPQFKHVIYVGQMSHEKGVFEFVRSAALLASSHPDLRFHLVGGSIYTAETELALVTLVNERGIADRVTFHGWVNNAREFLSRAAVHVAPSVWEEPFANVVLEAKREGTPSVVFPSGGLPEMIRHKMDGYIGEDKSDQALADGIAWVLARNPAEMSELRTLVAADYQERFGEERFCKAWADIYRITDV